MKNTFKGFSLVFVAMFLVFSIQDYSVANINEVGQSLKKDTVSSKATSEVQIKNKIAVSKSNTKAIKQPAKTISKTKTKSTEVKATINEVFKKSATAKDLYFKKLFTKYLKNPSIVRIDKASQSFKTLETNFNNKKLNKPKITAPLRIGQRAPVEGITPIGDFPNFEADPNDLIEIEGIKDVNDVYNNSDYFFSGTFYDALIKINSFESVLPSFCEKYSKYPHICAMMKFYCAEIRALIFSAPRYGVHYDGYKFQELYTQIDETYSKETGSKEELFKKLSEVCKERINYIASDINTGIGQKISENKAEIERCLNIIKKLKENNNIVEVVYKANGEGIKFYRIGNLIIDSFGTGIYDYVLLTYSQIIKDYCAMRKFDEASTTLNALNTFYSSEYPAKVTLNLIGVDDNGNEHQFGTESYTIKRDTTTYTDVLKKYMDWNSQYGEIAENGEGFQTKVTEIINNVNDYKFDESKDNISLQEFDNIKIKFPNKSDEGNDNYYSNKALLTQLYFANGENIKLQHNAIKNPLSTITLRGEVDNLNVPVYSIMVDVVSVVSKRIKVIVLKKDMISGQYMRSFSINEDELPDALPIPSTPEPLPQIPLISLNSLKFLKKNPLRDTYDSFFDAEKFDYTPKHYIKHKNIISNDKDLKPSIAAFDSEIFDGNLFDFYDLCTYFYSSKQNHNILGYSMKFDKKNIDLLHGLGTDGKRKINLNDQIINHLTKDFLKAGGGEYIIAINSSQNITSTPQLCKHQANWFVIDAHGDKKTGSIGSLEDDFYLPINELFDENDKSLYGKNMDMLILLTCDSLNYYKYKEACVANPDAEIRIFAGGWYKVLPFGTILGYNDIVDSKCSLVALQKLNTFLVANKKATPKEICLEWVDIHAKLYKEFFDDKKNKDYYKGAQYVTYILNDEWIAPKDVDLLTVTRSSDEPHNNNSILPFTFPSMDTKPLK